MQMVLEERDFWDVMWGLIKIENCVAEEDQAMCQRKAFAIICLAMEDSQLLLVCSATGALSHWCA